MKRGDAAREAVKNTIIQAFGENFVDVVDKKIYVNAVDGPGGETIQFAITMTMPKTPITAGAQPTSNHGAWSDAPQSASPARSTPSTPVELSPADKDAVAKLMRDLGIEQ